MADPPDGLRGPATPPLACDIGADEARRVVANVLGRAARIRRAWMWVYVALALAYSSSVPLARHAPLRPIASDLMPLLGLLVTAVGVLPVLILPRCMRAALAQADRLDDVRLIPALLDAAEVHRRTSDIAHSVLTRLLPRVTPADADLLGGHRVTQLCRKLSIRQQGAGELQLAILQALRQVGGEDALPAVQRLARSDKGPLGKAAHECLAALRERAQAASLLRPAEAPAGDTLLRPAAPATEAPAEQLLRPVEGE